MTANLDPLRARLDLILEHDYPMTDIDWAEHMADCEAMLAVVEAADVADECYEVCRTTGNGYEVLLDALYQVRLKLARLDRESDGV